MPPVTIPTVEPTVITAGESWRWDRLITDYPNSAGWLPEYYFQGPGRLKIKQSGGDTGTSVTVDSLNSANYQIAVTAAGTAALAAGVYRWKLFVVKGAEKYFIDEGVVEVQPNFETANAGDLQNFFEKQLTVIEAALSGRLTADMQSYQIAGRAVVKIPIKELHALHGLYRAQRDAARNRGKLGVSVRVVQAAP